MTRRSLLASALGCFSPRQVRLEAMAAAQLPEILTLVAPAVFLERGQLCELRSWSAPTRGQLELHHGSAPALLARHGLQPATYDYLIPFSTLSARAAAWNALAADEDWIQLRRLCQTSVTRIVLYRVL